MLGLPSLTRMLEWLEAGIQKGFWFVVSPGERLSLFFVLPTLAIATAVFVLRERRLSNGERGLFEYLFRRSVWLSPSAVLDYKYLVFTALVYTPIASRLVLSTFAVGRWVGRTWSALLGAPSRAASATFAVILVYTLVLELLSDLRRYLVHAAFHRFPLLWQFHKVHHSATTLTPVTFYRVHPVELYINATAGALVIALVTGTFQYLYPLHLSAVTILGVNAGRFAFDLFGANLRHSHVWISYGPVLEHLLISPAQHQIHHSVAPEHMNKNYGSELALWDWLFGSLCLPRGREELRYGIGAEENAHASLWQLCITPFRNAWALVGEKRHLTQERN